MNRMNAKDPIKALLKKALQGKLTPSQVQEGISHKTGDFVPVTQVSPGVYDLGSGQNGLTEEEMKAATLGKGNIPFVITVRRNNVP
jgi:hypothetical protein